jgi:hypothetical protein
MKVQFIELEMKNREIKIEEWFPMLEKTIERRLPQYIELEGGIYQLKDGTFHRWPGPHYYLCIPSDSFSVSTLAFFTPYGKIINSTEKEVDDSTFNENYTISYGGSGSIPRLEKKYKTI